jgi:hypothetical protein
MKQFALLTLTAAALAASSRAATIDWAAGIDNGVSLANGTDLPSSSGSLVRLGYFRDSSTGLQLTDAQIVALSGTPSLLNSYFVEAATGTIGSGFTPAIDGHFSLSSTVDTSSSGLNLAGLQMYVWILNAATLTAATQQGIYYWSITDTTTNPDSTPLAPGLRWSFPSQDPVPGSTTIDLTDLTAGDSTLASGARIVVGSFGTGTSEASGAPNFDLAIIVPEPSTATLIAMGGAFILRRRRQNPLPGAV